MRQKFFRTVILSIVFAVSLSFSIPNASAAVAKKVTKPAYDWQLVSQSPYPSDLKPGETANVWIEVKNTGTATWNRDSGGNMVLLGTGSDHGSPDQQKDYSSEFYNDITTQTNCNSLDSNCIGSTSSVSAWISPNRPARIMHPEVLPGWHTRFQFDIKAPMIPGKYRAYFTPVAESVSWMKDIGLYWEINVSRAYPYSFDYDNIDSPINAEVNKNTKTILSSEQQLAYDAVMSGFDYTSFSGSTNFALNFQFSDAAISTNKDSIDETNKNLSSMAIPFDLVAHSKDEVQLTIDTDNTAVKNNIGSQESLRTKIALATKSTSGQITSIFDGDVEAVMKNQMEAFIKVNKFNILGNYFSYAKSDTWYSTASSSNVSSDVGSGAVVYDNSRSQAIDFLKSYKNALARDLNRGGIVITNKGTEVIAGESTTHLQLLVDSINAKKYLDILNERSSTEQNSIDEQKAALDQYLAALYIDAWVNPITKTTKKISFAFTAKGNIVFDKLSTSIVYNFNSINSPSLAVVMPTVFEPIEKFDLFDQLQAKTSPTHIMMLRLSSAGNEVVSGVRNALNKASDYIRDIRR